MTYRIPLFASLICTGLLFAGVASAQANRIFDGTSTRQGGAGVGLKHARAIARAAGGQLRLKIDSDTSPR